MEKKVNSFDLPALLLGLLSVIVSIICLRNPLPTFSTVVIIAAIISILIGCYKLFTIRPLLEVSGWFTFNSILDIVVGILMLFNIQFGMLFVSISFAIMFLVDSFTALWFTRIIKDFSTRNYYWLDIILAVCGIILGVMLLISPILSAFSVSFLIALLFMIIGISLVAHSI
ncbi:DUF308 domain-containing protein [Pediococcus claussenii]|uniref:Membrane protein n=1 Tax=Pediococcus claussenii (strain ATCC BAA-344 / DSM 14800 / JCM 18046 / KCTC 3811 / LMG 21948 / P06) TaxID=701521 RepID=G8PB58_PEDCP|nr:DUF308 domain-containing protein [Pediococcus claussenii]AEV94687.1 putative membrane protein [Pediococcus claussenii ATCC BAA-344]ANZ69882.1 hypothetical protein AYR57_05975 [Pediococcus claussenii]ANZ71699.1 hypothetical protein AYR58_05980 [Pediococcus claussenii]KRN20866.1 hypothetical protein IV79_GL000088 [Pediococcus claussenii]